MSEHQRRQEHERRHSRAVRGGIAVSALLHAVILLLLAGEVAIPVSPFSAAGERRGSDRAAAGGGMEALELATPTPEPPAPLPPVPVPVATLEAPPPEEAVPEFEVPAIALAQGLATPGDPGDLVGPGLVTGEGEGDGGTDEEGLFRVVPPRPRGLILPPSDRPSQVRGKEVEIWVYVSAAGRVVPDSTRLFPPTGDRRFDSRLRDHASGWVFEAARKDGRTVAEWFRYTIVM